MGVENFNENRIFTTRYSQQREYNKCYFNDCIIKIVMKILNPEHETKFSG